MDSFRRYFFTRDKWNLYAFSKTQEQKQEVIVAKQIVKRFKANKETVFQEEDKFLKNTVKAEKDTN